jgi:uncharacterized protein
VRLLRRRPTEDRPRRREAGADADVSLPTRRWLRVAIVPFAAALALLASGAGAEPLVDVPALKARVTDLTGTLTPEQAAALEAKLSAFEQAKGSQVAVLIVPTTRPEEIEQYGIRVAEAWKLGRKGVDDGALLLVARDDRKVRIETGYGLEGVLPDATANRIIDEDIVPRFRAGDYYGGIDAGVERMLRVIEGEPLPEPERRGSGVESRGIGNLLPLLLIFALVGGSILRRVFGRVGGALATGGLVGLVTWLIIHIVAISAFAGVIAFILAVVGGMGGGPGGRGWYSGRGGRGIGFPGGFGGGGFGGGGGGFGGGGGGFGGGGASGSW